MHPRKHKWAGQTRKYKLREPDTESPMHPKVPDTGECYVEDWCDRLWKKSWGVMAGNYTALNYAMRLVGLDIKIPDDEEVVYVHVDVPSFTGDGSTYSMAFLMHESEIL